MTSIKAVPMLTLVERGETLLPREAQALAACVRDLAEALRLLLENVGACDDPAENPHVEVWCITHQQKRCTAGGDADRAVVALAKYGLLKGSEE